MRVMKRLSTMLWVLALSVATGLAHGQAFPTKPIRMVVPQSPGTLGDIVGRIMAGEMSKIFGESVIVENKPGANMIIGFDFLAKAPPDGYTIAASSIGDIVILPLTSKGLTFDPLKDFPPFIGIGESRFAFASSVKNPWKNFAELVAAAKANPGKLNYGASSPSVRLPIEALIQGLGLDVVHVPYSTGGAYLNGLMTGEVQMGLSNLPAAIGFGERYRILAVTGDQRSAAVKDVPTFRELGFPNVPSLIYSLNAPARVPKPVIDKLYSVALQALQTPEAKSQFAKAQVEILGATGEATEQKLQDIARTYAEIGRKIGVQAQ